MDFRYATVKTRSTTYCAFLRPESQGMAEFPFWRGILSPNLFLGDRGSRMSSRLQPIDTRRHAGTGRRPEVQLKLDYHRWRGRYRPASSRASFSAFSASACANAKFDCFNAESA